MNFASIAITVWQFILRGLGFGAKSTEPTAQDLSAGKATADADLTTETQANVQLTQAADVRAAADAQRVRDDTQGDHVTLDRAAPINSSSDAHFRD